MPRKMDLFIDLDEVIADFTGAALLALDEDPAEFQRDRPKGIWDITKHLGITHEVFWDAIDSRGEAFWEEIEPLPWAAGLIAGVSDSYYADWYILSSPGDGLHTWTGKLKWLDKYFGGEFQHAILTPHKHLLAQPGAILIDDRLSNICSWEAPETGKPGGSGILFPSLGNPLWKLAENPLPHVLEQLARLERENALQV